MITYNYTNTVFDSNAKGKLKNYDTVMSIPEDSLIKPENLKDYIGEVLMFYSPYGDVVSAILTDVEYVEMNPYMFQTKFNFMYTHGLNMSYFYNGDEFSKYFTVESTYIISVLENIDDDFTYPVYIGIPTKEQLDFRNYWLSQDNKYLTDEYNKLKDLFINR